MQRKRWHEYQHEVAGLFRSLGLTAEVDVPVRGARTSHDIDVVVRSNFAGVQVLWLVECRYWKKRIPKSAVLALRQIVDDVGADRGFLFSKKGYQSGAHEAALHSNITLTSLAGYAEVAADEICERRLQGLIERIHSCRERYWEWDKTFRIATGLRPEAGLPGYSAVTVMKAVEFTAEQALRGRLPIEYNQTLAALFSVNGVGDDFYVPEDSNRAIPKAELCELLEKEIGDVERLLDSAAAVQASSGELPN